MKRLQTLGTLAVLLLFSSGLSLQAQSLKKVHSMIEEMNTKMAESMVAGDYTASLAMYTDDAYSLPSYEPMIQGLEAMRKSAGQMADAPMKITSFETTIKEIIPGGDLFVELGTYTMRMDIEGMPEPMVDRGKYVTVWEKQDDGSLKIRVETWNSDMNPWEMMQ